MQLSRNSSAKPDSKSKTYAKPDVMEEIRKSYMKSMTPEQIKELQNFGESFWKDAQFTSKDYLKEKDKSFDIEEALSFVIVQMNSGLHPSFLSEDEESLLIAKYGKEYYKEWGYQTKELK